MGPTITFIFENPFIRYLVIFLAGKLYQGRRLTGYGLLLLLLIRRDTGIYGGYFHGFLLLVNSAFSVRNQNGKDLLQFSGMQTIKSKFQLNFMTSPMAISHGGATCREN